MLRASRLTTYNESNRPHRQRSTSQTNLAESSDRRQTYGGLRRTSSSTNIRTPRRTQARSPGNRTPSTTTGLTSNSEQNRRMVAENTAKVMELIQSSRTFFKSINLGNGGLKTMTLNQFIEIISFLMVRIGGKSTITKIRNNHDTVILNFLQTLNYPYAVNKACFKTPNAHHSFPEIMGILAFLSDLVCEIKQFAVPTEMPLVPCDSLVNDDFMRLFVAETLRNYIDYKSPREELLDEEGNANLVNGLVATKMKINGLTVNELAAKAEALKKSSEELQQKLIASDCDKYFDSIEEQFTEKENEHEKLQNLLAEKRKLLKMITLTHDDRARKLAAKQAELKQIMYKIQHQKYGILDIKQLIAKETSMKNAITMIQNEKETIEAEAADAQVKLARLQKLKLDIIRKFNDSTYHITKKLMQTHTFKNINVIDLTIDPAATEADILSTCLRLNQLYENCVIAKREYNEQIERSREKLEDYKSHYNRLTEKYTEQMITFQKANKNLDTLNQRYSQLEDEGTTNNAQLQREIQEKIDTKKRIEEEIERLRKKAEHLEVENVKIFADGERKAQDIIHEKQKLSQNIDKLSDLIDEHTNNS